MDITEAMISQHLCWTGSIEAVRKEVNNFDSCQRTKLSNIKCGKLPAKENEKIPWNKICVDIRGPYIIRRKVKI